MMMKIWQTFTYRENYQALHLPAAAMPQTGILPHLLLGQRYPEQAELVVGFQIMTKMM